MAIVTRACELPTQLMWRCREMLSDLAKLGYHFHALETFVDNTCSADAFLTCGLYRHALASGLTGNCVHLSLAPLRLVRVNAG
jgi:hypothetical protein